MTRPLKILHVAETAQGGVGSYIEEVLSIQTSLYGEECVRAVLPREHATHFRFPAGVVKTFDIGSGGRLGTMRRAALRALREVKAWRPDIVHLHSTGAGLVLRPLLYLKPHRPRVVYCAHGWAFDRQGSAYTNSLLALMERIWGFFCDAVVCISDHDLRSGRKAGISASRLVMIRNGIADAIGATDESFATLWPAGSLRILFVGRLDRQKGVDILYGALRQLGPRVSAVVVGAPVVADAHSALEPPHNATLVGWLPRDRIATLCHAAQLLVVPSRWEGFGLAAVEGMRAGRAVIASRVGGLAEVVEDGVTGLLIESESSDRLAEAIASVPDATLREMGAEGRKRYERLFHIRRVGDELDGLYRRLLRGAAADAA